MNELDRLVQNALIGGQTDPSLFSPIMAGVGRTDLSPLLSNVGLGAVTGGIDPVALEKAMIAEIQRQEKEYIQERKKQESVYEADVGSVPMLDDYVYTARPLLRDAEALGDEDWQAQVRLNFEAVVGGEKSAEQAGEDLLAQFPDMMQSGVEGRGRDQRIVTSPAVGLLNKAFEIAQEGREKFEQASFDYSDRRTKADTLLAGLGELPEFDRARAAREFYSDAGVPALGYMSSPSAQYQFDPAVIARAGNKQSIEDFRTQMRNMLGEEPSISPYSFGAEQQSAAAKARDLRSQYIERTIKKEEKKRQENANKLGEALRLLGASPFQTELGAMKDFALREALS